MAEQLTPQQLQAVEDRGGKLLVSAAAGSGKTKVLVDRLMSYLTDSSDPANLDEFLVITYTKAAAAELRGKIAAKLSQKIAEDPQNRHLQHQMQRLYLTKISTVHAFCSELLREYAYRLDISGDFRVAEENECVELQLRVIEQVLNSAYESAETDPDFYAFIDTQGYGRNDQQIPEIVLKAYNSARCHLDPEKWLDWCLSVGDTTGISDASDTVWGAYLIRDLQQYLDFHISALTKCAVAAQSSEGMEKPAMLLLETVDQLWVLRNCNSWDEVRNYGSVDFGRLVFSKKCTDQELMDSIKAVREACKKGLGKKLRRFTDDSAQILKDTCLTGAAARGLILLVRQFMDAYGKAKRARRILDFGDLEHKTLDLLLGKGRQGVTLVANEIGQRYREVMVDEYQDSNQVQDAIFGAITHKKHNCFMVGDVKQSIYQFRLADPGIFLEKYHSYLPAEEAIQGEGRKVLLSTNFRSSGEIISAVNDIFSVCMSEQVGSLEYGEEEALYEGIPHGSLGEPGVELYGIQVQQDTYAEEANFVAKRISQLLDGTHMVRDGEALRPITAGDIVILLRSPGSMGEAFSKALNNVGIRCSSGGVSDLLKTQEIETLRAILQIIDNPLQDIPLVAALTSPVFGFTADELAEIRSHNKSDSIFAALESSADRKIEAFLELLTRLRKEARMCTLPQLLQRIFVVTGLDNLFASMQDGDIRTENLQTFSQLAVSFDTSGHKSLSRFLKHLEAMDQVGLPSTPQSSEGAVTIMSIHRSKGLEFPVVFLCGLSREFNRESARAQVLCHKELGLGLSCVDERNRVRYPSLAKRAVGAKINEESLSEEMRVLYVALTRARDRLVMTYASRNLEHVLSDLALRGEYSDPILLTGDVDCPGKWVLLSALKRAEAGDFIRLAGCERKGAVKYHPWLIRVTESANMGSVQVIAEHQNKPSLSSDDMAKLRDGLAFSYGHTAATKAPSKQTATQMKGREKDVEAAEEATHLQTQAHVWRMPSFVNAAVTGKAYGNALHAAMQYISYDACVSVAAVEEEVRRLVSDGYISPDQGRLVDSEKIAAFFATDLGKRLRQEKNVLREFKFSILDHGNLYGPGLEEEKILLQGVVDCTMIESDGITIIDFKTDRVTRETVEGAVNKYRAQVLIYGNALERIFNMRVKSSLIYFFSIGEFVAI